MKTYVLVGDHAENLVSGVMLEPGGRVDAGELELTGKEPGGDQWLVDDGKLVDVESFGPGDLLDGKALEARARELEIEGRTKLTADELRAAVAQREAELAATEGVLPTTENGEQ